MTRIAAATAIALAVILGTPALLGCLCAALGVG